MTTYYVDCKGMHYKIGVTSIYESRQKLTIDFTDQFYSEMT